MDMGRRKEKNLKRLKDEWIHIHKKKFHIYIYMQGTYSISYEMNLLHRHKTIC